MMSVGAVSMPSPLVFFNMEINREKTAVVIGGVESVGGVVVGLLGQGIGVWIGCAYVARLGGFGVHYFR
jgi:hypothetical protein